MANSKAYSRINWKNYPAEETPLNESNLNKMDFAVDEIDNRVIGLDTAKLDKTTGATMIKDVFYNKSNGIFTVQYLNGATYNLDTKLEKLAINFTYDSQTQKLVITLDDGTKQYVDLSALITQFEFVDTDTLDFTVESSGKIAATVKDGSIKEKHLQSNYLADIKIETAKAQASVVNAQTAATTADTKSTESKSYAHGGTGTRPGENTDNARYYMEQAKIHGTHVTGVKGSAESTYRNGQVNITPADVGALSTAGGTVNGKIGLTEGYYNHYISGDGIDGYFLAATFVILQTYANYPISFNVLNRGRLPEKITILFTNVNNVDPELNSFTVEGGCDFYLYKSAPSTWDLYIRKSEAYDSITITELNKAVQTQKIKVIWKSVSATTLPAGAVRCTVREKQLNITGNATTALALKPIKLTNEDLNTIYTPGDYFGEGVNSCINKPTDADAFGLRVYQTAGAWYAQELSVTSPNVDHNEKKWFRQGNSVTKVWTDWSFVYTTLHPQEAVNKLATPRRINGVAFDGTKDIEFSAPLRQILLANEDLNNITGAGFYYSGGNNTCTNKPPNVNAFGLIVYRTAGSYIAQDLISGDANTGKRWSRQASSNVWSEWSYTYTTLYPQPVTRDFVGQSEIPEVISLYRPNNSGGGVYVDYYSNNATGEKTLIGRIGMFTKGDFVMQYPPGNTIFRVLPSGTVISGGKKLAFEGHTHGDINDQTPTYSEAATLTELASGEKLSTAFGKIKLAVKNVISLVQKIGSTSIAGIGNGTVTGAISTMNTQKANVSALGTQTTMSLSETTLTITTK